MITVDAKDLKAALKLADRLRAKAADRPILNMIWVEAKDGELIIRAADGYCGFRRVLPAGVDEPVQFQVEAGIEKHLPKKGRVTLDPRSGGLIIGKETFKLWHRPTPDLDSIFSRAAGGQVAELNAASLMQALLLCQAVEPRGVVFSFREDGVFLSAKGPERGTVEHQISDTVYPVKYSVTFNPAFVLNYLRGWTKAQQQKLILRFRLPAPKLFGDYDTFRGEWGFWSEPRPFVINEEFIVMPMQFAAEPYIGSKGYNHWKPPFVWWNPDNDFNHYYNLYKWSI